MASSSKYQKASTVDPDDAALHDDHPPPAYDSEASRGGSVNPLLGTPRSPDDNVPDDFKFGGTVAEASVEVRHVFIRKVYSILTVQLAATAGLSTLSVASPAYRAWIQSHGSLVWLSFLGAMVFLGLTYWKRKSYPTNLGFLAGFTLMEAYSVSVATSFYRADVVVHAAVLTGAIFAFLTLFACQTRYDFTSWITYLFGAVWALVAFSFLAVFLPHSSTVDLVWGLVAALVFSAYVLVDTQLVMRHHHVEEEISAAISLYLDIINLFLAILRILNSQRD